MFGGLTVSIMVAGKLFEPALSAYVGYCVGFCIRYFAVGCGIYWVFHVAFREKWLAHRIQQVFPSRDEVAHGIRWSMSNMAFSGVSAVVLYWLIRDGRTSMYFGVVGRDGWLYCAVSVVLGIAGYDAWFYWYHRLLHTPWLFQHVHATHHRAANPTAFAAFAHHPIETFLGNAYFVLFVMLVPVHPMAFGAVGAYLFTVNIIAHMGYEFYPRGFTRHRLLRWWGTSTHHNMHHRYVGCNYGIVFNYWDRLMGTNHPAYDETFDAITARVGATARERPAAALPRKLRLDFSPTDTRN